MSNYNPSMPFNVAIHLLNVTSTENVKGTVLKKYSDPSDDNIIFCSFKTYGGTEQTSNGVLSVIDTANIETWYRPDIKSDCRVCLAENPKKQYEIIGEPENINMRNQFIKFKVRAVKGGA